MKRRRGVNRVIDISVESTLFTNESISIDEYEMACSFEYPARVEAGRTGASWRIHQTGFAACIFCCHAFGVVTRHHVCTYAKLDRWWR